MGRVISRLTDKLQQAMAQSATSKGPMLCSTVFKQSHLEEQCSFVILLLNSGTYNKILYVHFWSRPSLHPSSTATKLLIWFSTMNESVVTFMAKVTESAILAALPPSVREGVVKGTLAALCSSSILMAH